MIKRTLLTLIIFVCSMVFLPMNQILHDPPLDSNIIAENGRMDLTSWDMDKNKIVDLDGEWEFYRNVLLIPEDFQSGSNMEATGFMKVPSLWNGRMWEGVEMPNFGCATYRLVLEGIPYHGVMGLKKNNVRFSSRIYVNGKELFADGNPARNSEEYQSGNTPQIGFINYDSGSVEILIQVANYEYLNSGIPASIELGTEAAMLDRHQKEYLFAFTVFIILLTIALLHFIFYIVARIKNQRQTLQLLFSIFCFLFAIGNGLTDQRPLLLVLPDIPFTLVFKLKDFFLSSNFIVVVLIFHKFEAKLLSYRLTKGISLVYGAYLVAVLLLPIHIYYKIHLLVMMCNTVVLLILLVRVAALYIRKAEGFVLFMAILTINLYSLDCILFSLGFKSTSGFGQIYILAFAFVIIAFLSMQYFTAINRLQYSLRYVQDAEIAFLRAQINPHFLFNALNSIAALCREAPKEAEDVVVELSQYLRRSFDFKPMDSMSTLTAELELLEAYLKIEKVRFGKRLKVIYDIEEDLNVPIPPLILQPLVENAVKHGLMGNRQGGTVTISIRRQGEDVAFSIIDNGVGMDQGTLEPLLKEKAEKGRVGIWNINRRLNIIYGRELSVTSIHGKGTNVSFVLPMERKKYSIYSSN